MSVRTSARRGVGMLATALRIVGMVIVAFLVLHIVLTLLDANPANGLTTFVADVSSRFTLGLDDLFLPDEPKLRVTLNYGVAAIVWWLITAVVVRLVRRVS
ncbi:hypothetical protein ACFQ34_15405 [Pseudonocardia benzenivorans]|jgi:hypothetical protein|uniref:YGGT family protein n=2 Tax=Pseudonocardia TaxID=1847 RepID=F4CS73_PSEUX|nr:hypothetical protein [Pseudonocardia dioxanivorans]AEA22633.1 hypothetical protein Psed_0360 [Pseudonocardia dioxanivorans CB1190]GJF07663.1 hypothetical protein PSD17_66080 [Pseudonocardia sp. D17]